MTTGEELLTEILNAFDSLDLDKEQQRRASVMSLYDYFRILTLEVGVPLCGINRNVLKQYLLRQRWQAVKECLSEIEDPSRWDEIIFRLHKMRNKIEHTDYRIPSKAALLEIRRRAPEFKAWITRVGKQYYGKSEGFSFIQKYSLLSSWYTGQADWMISLFGDEPPYCVEREIVLPGEEPPYERLKSLRDAVESRSHDIDSIDDLTQDDLGNLVELIKVIERLDARESVFLQQNICPKCGGKITQTQRAVGGSAEEPMPYAVIYRIGCENCDYEIDSETIEV